jgi:ribosomal protein L13
VDCGDNVIVINSEKSTLQVTNGRKDLHASQQAGGQRTLTAKVLQAKKTLQLSRKSGKRMLPKIN